jgi:amino acid transporter
MTSASRPPAPSADAREQGLQNRAIGFWGALAMSVAAMGPLLGALGVAPLVVSQAGFSAPFIFLVSWIAMFAVALTIGRFCGVLPGAASIYSYITHGLGERVGFLTTWLSFSYYLFFVPLLLAAVGIYGSAMATDVLHANIDWWIWSLLAAAIVTTLAIVGIGLSMRIDLTLAIVCDGFLLLVSLIIIGKVIGDGNFTLAPLSPSHAPSSFTGLSLALAFGILIFLGFEQSFVLGEEVNDPHGNVPKAIYTALGLIGAVLFLAMFAMILGFGSSGIGRLNALVVSQGTPWFALVKARLGQAWVDILEVLIVLSILSNTIASTNSVVRIQYGMGRARALPRQLGYTLPSRRTPYVAIGMTMSVSLAITLIAGSVWSPTSLFAFGGFAIGFAAAIAFIMIALAAVMYFRKVSDGAGWFRNWGVPIIAAVILLPVVYTSFYPDPGYPLKWAPRLVIGWLIAGVVYLAWRISTKQAVDIDYAFADIGETIPPEALATEPHAESV